MPPSLHLISSRTGSDHSEQTVNENSAGSPGRARIRRRAGWSPLEDELSTPLHGFRTARSPRRRSETVSGAPVQSQSGILMSSDASPAFICTFLPQTRTNHGQNRRNLSPAACIRSVGVRLLLLPTSAGAPVAKMLRWLLTAEFGQVAPQLRRRVINAADPSTCLGLSPTK